MALDVPMPKLGLTMEEATIVEWLVADGTEVESEQPIMLIETDKTEIEVESPKIVVKRPNSATKTKRMRPAWSFTG